MWTEGRAGRVIPGHWRAGVHYAFADDGDRYRNVEGYGGDLAEGEASEGLSFRVLEEVVVRRGDGTTRVARIEAMHEDEVVVVDAVEDEVVDVSVDKAVDVDADVVEGAVVDAVAVEDEVCTKFDNWTTSWGWC